jgi:hypothetical protein
MIGLLGTMIGEDRKDIFGEIVPWLAARRAVLDDANLVSCAVTCWR